MQEAVFQWREMKKGEACILEGYGASPFVVVPERMDGMTVTSIGAYCFSDARGGGGECSHFQRRLSGEFIQKVCLPDSVREIGNLAFYNCTGLQEIQIGPSLVEVGGDAFMNCSQMGTVRVRGSVTEKNGLKQLLGQRTSDTEVVFETDGRKEAVLFYPEYDETYQEVGPAHIFALHIAGEGFRARQCFRDGVVDLAQYDGIFEQAAAEDSPAALCWMAVNRLCYPAGLSREAEERYRGFLGEREELLVEELVRRRSLERLEIVFREGIVKKQGQEAAISMASQHGWTEGAAALLRLRHTADRGFAADRYSF